jgi:hypothetical protein
MLKWSEWGIIRGRLETAGRCPAAFISLEGRVGNIVLVVTGRIPWEAAAGFWLLAVFLLD